MQVNQKLTELKNKLPLGAITEIAEKTGLTAKTIDNIFKGKPCRANNLKKLITETENYIKEYESLTGVSSK
ncbi:hypothetical protein [Chryseobacterium profundimaris]|uniref:HTH cro/C1-type domain-containing protein n=1 Tax=Chryseobacterium profundimaris TaxID=1387275 RepID=A0ABY1NG73_9FLAO|nr:hypothetical protein [Chryseobacterium profundimaris]SMP08864.1 hypothetical protein SAMN06264346_1025 [Chryseobacterium profundimaris]